MQLHKKVTCLLDGGECRAENFFYKATIKTDNLSKIYFGLNASKLKNRTVTHNTTTNSKSNDKNYLQYKDTTELSKLTHKLKKGNKNYKLTWKILKWEKI